MLTKTDLQAIQKIVGSSIQKEVKPLRGDIKTLQTETSSMRGDIKTLQTETSSMRGDIKTLQTDVTSIKKDVKNVKSRVRKMNKTIDVMIDSFNRDDIRLGKRVKKIEEQLGIAPSSI